MLGNAIVDGVQSAIGTYGYVVSFDLSSFGVKEIEQVQMQDTAGVLSLPSTSPLTRAQIFELCEDAQGESESPITFGYFLDNSVLFIFCKTDIYPYIYTNRVAWWIKRFVIDMATTANTIDVAQDKEQLLRNLVLEAMYVNSGSRVPSEIAKTIQSERLRLSI